MALVLGIDVGTQSTKCLLYDSRRKKTVARSSAAYPLISRSDGTREQQPTWWTEAVLRCLKRLPAGLKSRVEAIGVSGQQHGLVALDHSGKPLVPAKLWCDTATTVEAEALEKKLGGAKGALKKVGVRMLPGYTAPKIAWLKKHRPKAYKQVRHFLLPHDYVNFWLTGQFVTESGDASGTGYFDVRKRQWSKAACRALDAHQDWAAVLPKILESWQTAGTLSASAAKALGLKADIPVSVGGGDNMMAAIGTGAVEAGLLVASLGTSGTLFSAFPRAIVDDNAELAAFCSSSGTWLPLLCTMNCTVATEAMRGTFGWDLARLQKEAGLVAPGAEGVSMVPFFNGERVPNLPRARASFNGLTVENLRPGVLARASMEAAIYGLKVGLLAFKAQGLKFKALRLTGGGSKSPLWRQMAADIFEMPVNVPVEQESAAFGAALQALWCLGKPKNHAMAQASMKELIAKHVKMDKALAARPKVKHSKQYRSAFAQYQAAVNINGTF